MKKHFILLFSLLALTANTAIAQEKKALDINKILSATNSAAGKDKKANSAREARFKTENGKHKSRLNKIKGERAAQERLSDQLDATYNSNEVAIEQLTLDLTKELGDLKELFGVIQQTASEAQEDYKTSLVSAQFPDRAENLRKIAAKMGNTNELVSIDEIEVIWHSLQNELVQQGKVVKFNSPVSYLAGTEEDAEGKTVKVYEQADRNITRVGVFNAVSDGDIATYHNEKGLILLDRQMNSGFTSKSQDLQSATGGVTPFYVDPTKGGLVTALVRKPTLVEKIQEGGVVGYIIIILGIVAMLIALFKILTLSGIFGKVKKQANDLSKPSLSNPLGRILKVFQDNPNADAESMDLKLSEQILKETPKLQSWLTLIKIIAVVAPLLGLLGTVTGMIQTFQAITLYGAGDPQMMAGGISQALVTTVLGLVVAIPTVFFHWLASSRAKAVEEVLEEQVTVLVAEQVEAQG